MNSKDLSERLSKIANMVTSGGRFADIGCDHGFLAMYLTGNGICSGGIASDLRSGPLSAAKEHIAAEGMDTLIETRLSNGLSAYRPGEADSIILAGMGGPLIMNILADRPDVVQSAKEIIISPQSRITYVRAQLLNLRLIIADEDMVYEDGKFYPILRLIPEKQSGCTCEKWQGMRLEDMREKVLSAAGEVTQGMPADDIARGILVNYGDILITRSHPVFTRFLEYEYRLKKDVIRQLTEETHTERCKEIQDSIVINQTAYALCSA